MTARDTLGCVERENSQHLRELLRSVGGLTFAQPLHAAVPERGIPENPVALYDLGGPITAKPLNVAGFVDGIQNALAITYRQHRPVFIAYTAAAIVQRDGHPTALREHLQLMCSYSDEAWLREHAGSLNVHVIDAIDPDEVANNAFTALGATRETAERDLVTEFLKSEQQQPLLIDGSLLGRTADERLVGVVKTSATRFLADETPVRNLREGERSEAFTIPASSGHHTDRFSAYVRLHDASNSRWDHGLIRIETFSTDLIDPLAALCFHERQRQGSPDMRWDRHIAGVRMVEEYLRARRPEVFSL